MPPAPRGHDVQQRRISWPSSAWRIIASRFPPINLFERVTNNPAVWDVLIELEVLTNPRIRDETGEISLVPPDRRVSGNGVLCHGSLHPHKPARVSIL
jgi:hypothetical protein